MSLGWPARSVGRTAVAASLGAFLTLAAFVLVLAAFVVAPLLVLAVALVAHVALRPRRGPTTGPSSVAGVARYDFGSGAR